MSKSTSTGTHIVVTFCTHNDDVNTSVDYWSATVVCSLKQFNGRTLDQLFKSIRENHITRVYFHDDEYCFSYIYNYLVDNNVMYDPDINESDHADSNGLYNHFILDGYTYYIKYKYIVNPDSDNIRCATCTFVSSKKMLRNSVSDIASLFNIGPVVNESLQHCIQYQLNNNDIIKTNNSSLVVAKFIKEIKSDIGLTELTIGSNAIKSWKKLDNKHELFSEIPLDIERDLYKAYRGGYNWINKDYVGKDIGDGVVIDCNSLFSFEMYNWDCPVGIPTYHKYEYEYDDNNVYRDNLPRHNFYIVHIYVGGDDTLPGLILKNKKLPIISSLSTGDIKNDYKNYVYNADLWLTGFDFELVSKNYDSTSLKIIEFYEFDHLPDLFNNFIDHWYSIKKDSTGPMREVSKLFLDNVHGKLGTKIECQHKDGYRHQKSQYIIKVNDKVKFKDGDDTKNKGIRYIPASIFINSISRYYIIRLAQTYYDRLLYIDTDGLHLKGLDVLKNVVNLSKDFNHSIVIGPDMGEFKVESVFKNARYLGLKSYIHDEFDDFDKFDESFSHSDKSHIDVTLAGASDMVTSKLDFNNFVTGTIIKYSKFGMHNLCGGKTRYLTSYKITQGAQKN